jgi:hypothetical protein
MSNYPNLHICAPTDVYGKQHNSKFRKFHTIFAKMLTITPPLSRAILISNDRLRASVALTLKREVMVRPEFANLTTNYSGLLGLGHLFRSLVTRRLARSGPRTGGCSHHHF